MNVKRFLGRNTRDAMAKVRTELGNDAVILKNRAVDGGVEILAMIDEPPELSRASLKAHEEAVRTIRREAPPRAATTAASPGAKPVAASKPPVSPKPSAVAKPAPAQKTDAAPKADPAPKARPVAAVAPGRDTSTAGRPADEPEAMSTVSFQEYVRERARRRQLDASATPSSPAPDQPSAESAVPESVFDELDPVLSGSSGTGWDELEHAALTLGAIDGTAARPIEPQPQAPAPVARIDARVEPKISMPAPASPHDRADFTPRPLPEAADLFGMPDAVASLERKMMGELRAMRGFLGNQLASLAWFDGIRRDPIASRLLKRMIGAGFSASLARETVRHLPADCDEAQADDWLRKALVHNLKSEPVGAGFVERGGVYALIGPTGVGKTTTAAKIAAQFALRHGAQSVGLITVDMYRIGAQDQLRTFGRLLGVPVHVAQDAQTLAEYVRFFATKKLVLIDTAGLGQRDERVGNVLAALSAPDIQRLVVINAASQPETIDDVVHAYRASQCAGVVLSKIDEAVKLGGAIDALLRHRLTLAGIANGQRVPEDWHAPDPTTLVKLALSAHVGGTFRFDDGELAALFVRDGVSVVGDHHATER